MVMEHGDRWKRNCRDLEPEMKTPKTFAYRLAPAPRNGGFAMDDWWVWCGSAIRGEDGQHHLFASRWPKKHPFYSGYFYYSEIVRAVADNPLGPYRFQELVLGSRELRFWDGGTAHNPTIHRIGGRYCLFYTGHTFPGGRPADEAICRKPPYGMETGDCIGVATAPSVLGPWTRFDRPILAPRPNAWDRARVTNPAVCVASDGRIRLYYRSDRMQLGVAEAGAVEGPYRRLGDGPIAAFAAPHVVEDMYVWHNGQGYEMLAKDCSPGGILTGEERAGVHATSADGLAWTVSRPAKAYSRTILWDDGTPAELGCLERAQLLIEDGCPRALFFAVGDGPGGFERSTRTWNLGVALRKE